MPATKKTTTKRTSRKPKGMVELIRHKLKHKPFRSVTRSWLDTGHVGLNAIFGHSSKGIPGGKILELSGPPSSGKSALAMDLSAVAQEQGRHIIWVDFEDSFDVPSDEKDTSTWASKRGLRAWEDCPDFSLFAPYIAEIGGKKDPRLTTAEEVITEVEMCMELLHKLKPSLDIWVVLDSVTSMLPEEEAVAGLLDSNMRTNLALARLMGQLTRRWVSLLPQFNATALFINQLRQDPKAYGDGWYSPGGNALPFYAHIRARMRRTKGGRILRKGDMVGVKGILRNDKNKAGGVERREIGYKIYFAGESEFIPVKQMKEES